MAETLDGLISFFGSRHAIRADKTLRQAGMPADLIPGPKDLSPNCGVALRFELAQRDRAVALLEEANVEIDEIHPYRPRTDDWGPPAGRRVRGLRRRGRQ